MFFDHASRYNHVNKSNLMHNLVFVYFVNFYRFRAYLGPSSGGTTVCIQQLVLIFFLDVRLLSALQQTIICFSLHASIRSSAAWLVPYYKPKNVANLGLQRQIQAVFDKYLLALDNDDIHVNLSRNSIFPLHANNNIEHWTCVPHCRQRLVQLNNTDWALLWL
jgi:hypothetical protein